MVGSRRRRIETREMVPMLTFVVFGGLAIALLMWGSEYEDDVEDEAPAKPAARRVVRKKPAPKPAEPKPAAKRPTRRT